MMNEKDCKLKFLSLYSSDFNFIEYSFSVIKHALKKVLKHRIQNIEDLQELINKVLKVARIVVTPKIARNQFRHCNIQVDYV